MPEFAAGCFTSVETDGLSILIERDLAVVVGLSIRIDLLRDEDTDGALVPITPPIRDLLPELIDGSLETEVDGVMRLTGLPSRDLPAALLLIEVEPVELLLTEVLEAGPREIGDLDGLEIVIRLDVAPLGLLPDDIVAERLGVDRLTDILLELPRPRADWLVDNELEPLSVDRLVAGILPTDAGLRLEVIVLDRLGVGGLLILLRLEIVVLGRLAVGRLLADDRLTLLRLDVIGRDGLGVGALLTDDMLALLRLDVTDLVEGPADRELLLLEERAEALALGAGADLVACVL